MIRTSRCQSCGDAIQAKSRGPLPLRCVPCQQAWRKARDRERRGNANQSTEARRNASKRAYDQRTKPLTLCLRWGFDHGHLETKLSIGDLRTLFPNGFSRDVERPVRDAYRTAPRGKKQAAGWAILAPLLAAAQKRANEENAQLKEN